MGTPYSKEDKEKVYQLYDQGMTRKEIAIRTGVAYGAVTRWLQGRVPNAKKSGDNADRHLCQSCRYRANKYSNGCDFLVITGMARRCKVEECNRYEKGTPPRRRAKIM